MKGRHFARSAEPWAFDGEWHMCEVQDREVLIGVGLDLETHGLDRWDFGVEAKPQTETESAQVEGFARQPGERLVQSFLNGLDRSGMDLHEVNVFGITSLRLQVKLVQGGATAPRKFLREKRIGENLNNRAADDKILLDE